MSTTRLFWLMLGASIGLGATWIYPSDLAPEKIACMDQCLSTCGLPEGPPRPLTLAETVRMRRYLAGDPVP